MLKKNLLPISFSAISFALLSMTCTPVVAQDSRQTIQSNLQATRDYYAQLIQGSHSTTSAARPRLAELTMLMNMLPKGGDIHHHYSGSVYAEHYLDWVAQRGFCIYRDNDAVKKQERLKIETRPEQLVETNKNCLKVDAIRKDNFLYRELLMAWSTLDYGNHVQHQVPPDQHFFNTFGYFSGIAKYSTNQGLQILKQQAKAENQQYLETMLKSAPVTDHPELSAKIDALGNETNIETLHQAWAQFADFLQNDPQAQKRITDYVNEAKQDVAGIDDDEFSLRIQSYVSRNSSLSRTFSGLFAAFSASQNNPLIVGVNIVGPEHGLVALRDYRMHMQMFAFLKQRFPKVRLSLHAGELSLGMVQPEHLQHHIRTAVQIAGAERIGHAVDLIHEAAPDQLLAEIKQRDVALEINLTSNEFILGMKPDAHPVALYLRHQVPFVISSDDAGVSRNNLSHEYVLFASRYQPSYDTLKATVFNSIRYSFLSDADKTRHIQMLTQRFHRFEAAAAKLALSLKHTKQP
ncbi:adenosine deaminase [Undibacterium fentianense]|uniref:adenosine deaminase n=1 Tax=Undibacterium fentianense TaxID=2828728 RepID=A0A941IDC4_9BURK|nr:adenosine deaminase [Undibacterium fentianense]MBR7799818.1 adenosine deaminase [Undibacterium fentianense]